MKFNDANLRRWMYLYLPKYAYSINGDSYINTFKATNDSIKFFEKNLTNASFDYFYNRISFFAYKWEVFYNNFPKIAAKNKWRELLLQNYNIMEETDFNFYGG